LKDVPTGVNTARTEHGSVILSTDGAFTYTPDTGYHGPDQFDYLATGDPDGDSKPATVHITVGKVSYHGGPLLENVGVETVYYGQAWTSDPQLRQQAQQLDAFFQDITQSTYMDMMAEYG